MNEITYTCESGRTWTIVPGETYTDSKDHERRKAGHASYELLPPVVKASGDRETKTPGLRVNVGRDWAEGRNIALRGGDNGGQARLAVADVETLHEVITADVAELFGKWDELNLTSKRLDVEATPAPTAAPSTDAASRLLAALLAPKVDADPWQAVRDAGVDNDLILQLHSAGITPEQALATISA